MNEFSTPITSEQKAFLFANKNELLKRNADGTSRLNSKGDPIKDDAGGAAIWQNRVKMASEAYQELRSIETDHSLTSLVNKDATDEDDQVDFIFPDWPTFRDNFILDWVGSRTVVSEKEADMIFERTAEEALTEIEQAEANTTPVATAEDETFEQGVAEAQAEPVAAPKKVARKRKTVAKKAAPKKVAKKAPRKVAAKKKSGGSASAKAQVIVEKYAARDWSRKDIIAKLQDQLGMGAAYAATLYQKFA